MLFLTLISLMLLMYIPRMYNTLKYNVSYRSNWFGGEAVFFFFLQSLKLSVFYIKLPTQFFN